MGGSGPQATLPLKLGLWRSKKKGIGSCSYTCEVLKAGCYEKGKNRWLGDEILPSYVGITSTAQCIINHCKDPHQRASMMESKASFFFRG